jgi:hypothetical protein
MGVLSVAASRIPLLHLQALRLHDEQAHAEVVGRFGLKVVSNKSWYLGKNLNRIISSSSSGVSRSSTAPSQPSSPTFAPEASPSSLALEQAETVLNRKVSDGTLSAQERDAILLCHREIATHEDDEPPSHAGGSSGGRGEGARPQLSSNAPTPLPLSPLSPPLPSSAPSSTLTSRQQPPRPPTAAPSSVVSSLLVSNGGGEGGRTKNGGGLGGGGTAVEYAFFPHYASLFAGAWVVVKFGFGLESNVVSLTPACLAFLFAVVFFLGRDSAVFVDRPASSGKGGKQIGKAGVSDIAKSSRALFEAKAMMAATDTTECDGVVAVGGLGGGGG